MSFDTEVRAAVLDLADEGVPPAGIAASAWRHGRRQHARRRGFGAAVALIAVAAVTVGYISFRAGVRAPSAAASTPAASAPSPAAPSRAPSNSVSSHGPIAVAGSWIVGGGPSSNGVWVWDRVHEKFIDVKHTYAYPAPTGNYVVVQDSGDVPIERVGILDLATGVTHWIASRHSTVGGVDWSADGTRFVYALQGSAGNPAVDITDVRTGHSTALPSVPYDGGTVAWLPGDAEIAVDTQATTAQAYSAATGTPTRKVPSFGASTAWSPDGRYVVSDPSGSPTIIDAVTGHVIGELGGSWYASRIYWAGNTSVIVEHSGGPTSADNSWIQLDLTGRELANVPMPKEFGVSEGHEYTLVKR